ncbi:MAG: hypothetical protein HKN23_12540 [Verrucomicrobiales bacterium]|nr:hypothetical protein [Verrucomicrobiales bacterium]
MARTTPDFGVTSAPARRMPSPHALSLIIVLIALVIFFVAGLLAGTTRPRWLTTAMAIAIVLILLRFVVRRYPTIEYTAFDGDWYSFVRPWWGFPPALFLTGAAIPLIRRFSVRVLAKAAAGIVLFVSLRMVVSTLAMDHSPRMENFPDPETGLVTQTTLYSCGAAAAAMLLHFEGIQTSEGEMATICGTNAATATDEFSVRMGLREKLSGTGKRVILEKTDFANLLRDYEPPMMAVIQHRHLFDHWILIKSISPDGTFTVLNPDPEKGEQKMDRETFQQIWRNIILRIE